MGIGSYRASDWAALRTERKIEPEAKVEKIYGRREAYSVFLPSRIRVRESRDSVTSPESTPVIIGFDVTSSMGYLAKELAVTSIERIVSLTRQSETVTDPQFMCAAIGDVKSDRFPLQVTQFESDVRIMDQLLQMYLEGGGGGNGGESYDLLWYFAGRKTSADCFEKRDKKGILITIGDDMCHPGLSVTEIKAVFGDEPRYAMSNEELIMEVTRKYDCFHINIAKGTDADADRRILMSWQDILPGRATEIRIADMALISDLVLMLMAVASGKTSTQALASLDQHTAERLSGSMALISGIAPSSDEICF